MIKAAFFDIDGTLLSFITHRVSPGTVRAFDRLHRAGVRTFLSTGRPQVLIPDFPVSFEAHITMNGGYVFTPDRVLLSNPLPAEAVSNWVDFAIRHKLCTMLFTADSMMLAQPNEVAAKLRDQLEFTMPPVTDIECMRHAEAYQLIAVMPPALDDLARPILHGCSMPRWHQAFTDIVAQGNTKALGMDAICRHYGIRQDETIAFGDGANDIEMLQWAGTGIAMGNASDDLKAVADMVTTDVDNEGIEHAINILLS